MDKALYPNARAYLTSQLWAVRPETLDIIGDVLNVRASGRQFTADEISARINGGPGRPIPSQAGTIAVLPICGVIDQKVSAMTEISGGTSVNSFMESFRAAINDKSVTAIILDVDSPGGSVSGIPEAADEMYRARGKKPIIAIADPMIASAAYWLASAADEIICMPSGQVGSIGIICVHSDHSEANKMAGVLPTYITYGQFKAESNSDSPLSEDARAYAQGQVDQMGDMFVKFVAKARGVSVDNVRKNFGQGRMLMPKDALAAGMIDSIGTIDQAVAKLSRPGMKAEEEGLAIEAVEDKDFSTMTEREATKQVLVGLDSVTPRWGGLVDHALASGKKPGAILSKTNTDAVLNLRKGVADNLAAIDGIVQRAGIEAAVEPVVEDVTEPVSTDTDGLAAIAEYELIVARNLGVIV